MFKKLIYVLPLVMVIFLVGCNNSFDKDVDSCASLVKDLIPSEANGDIVLPNKVSDFSYSIVWHSDNSAVIGDDGSFHAPLSDTDVTLNFTISDGKNEKSFSVTVKATGQDLTTYRTWLSNISFGEVYDNITLPLTHPELGGVITWKSDKPNIIANDGTVNLPQTSDEDVVLSYEAVINGEEISSGSISVTVKSIKTIKDIISSSLDSITASIPTLTSSSVTLPTSFYDSLGTISWVSNANDVIANDGTFTNPSEVTVVTLTFQATLYNQTVNGTIKVTVSPLIDTNALDFYVVSLVPTKTFGSLCLPSTYNDIAITWKSGNPAVISDSGEVTAVTNEEKVTLTYSYQMNGKSMTNNIYITVVPNGEYLEKFGNVTTFINSKVMPTIIFDITLPTSYDGATIKWFSEMPDILTTDGKCLVDSGDWETFYLYYVISIGDVSLANKILVDVIDMSLEDLANEALRNFPKIINANVTATAVSTYEGFTFAWRSSDQNILTDAGIFTRPVNDTVIDIIVDIFYGDEVLEARIEKRVIGIPIDEKTSTVLSWVNNVVFRDTYIKESDNISLPMMYEEYGATISWTSSNDDVVTTEGVIKHYPFDRYVDLDCVITFTETEYIKTSLTLVIEAKKNATDDEKVEYLLEAITVTNLPRVTFNTYSNITQSYNILPFVDFDKPISIVEQIAPLGENRPGTELTAIAFITVHDTANNGQTANAQGHANYVGNGGGGTSWHYTVDQDGAFHQIPNDEVAYHAGDGRRPFELLATGVTATRIRPSITIGDDGYYYLNGVKSSIESPEGTRYTTSDITPSGIYTTIIDGEYYMNRTYYNTGFGKISNCGGNYSSIGIETCVNNGSDYMKTVHVNAKLVAWLCTEYNLGLDRIMQHNNFSGKPCPNALRQAGYWTEFVDLVSLYQFAMTLSDTLTLKWTSTCDILSDDGVIAKNIGSATSVTYQVEIDNNGKKETKTFTTNLK